MKSFDFISKRSMAKSLSSFSKNTDHRKQNPPDNPQNIAKYSLLEISQEKPKINRLNFSQNSNYYSYSTQFFANKNTPNQSKLFDNLDNLGIQKRNEFNLSQKQKNIFNKTTYSSQMRKAYFNHLKSSKSRRFTPQLSRSLIQNQQQRNSEELFRKTNYSNFIFHQIPIVNSQNSFHSNPSKQIISILKKVNLRQKVQNIDKQKLHKTASTNSPLRKKSIFCLRQLITADPYKSQKKSPKQVQSPRIFKKEQDQKEKIKSKQKNNFIPTARISTKYKHSPIYNYQSFFIGKN